MSGTASHAALRGSSRCTLPIALENCSVAVAVEYAIQQLCKLWLYIHHSCVCVSGNADYYSTELAQSIACRHAFHLERESPGQEHTVEQPRVSPMHVHCVDDHQVHLPRLCCRMVQGALLTEVPAFKACCVTDIFVS